MTGDWFYNERINRFSALPGHDLVKVSLKSKPQCKYRKRQWISTVSPGAAAEQHSVKNCSHMSLILCSTSIEVSFYICSVITVVFCLYVLSAKRETAGEPLLRSNEVNRVPPVPFPRIKLKNQTCSNNGFVSLLCVLLKQIKSLYLFSCWVVCFLFFVQWFKWKFRIACLEGIIWIKGQLVEAVTKRHRVCRKRQYNQQQNRVSLCDPWGTKVNVAESSLSWMHWG